MLFRSQAADEALHAAERRTVDHHRAVRLVVGADVAQVEADRQVVVDLHGAELPLAADHVLNDKVDLRAVEGGLAGLLGEGHTQGLGGRTAGVFSFVPVFRVARVLVGIGIPGEGVER